ncbi:ADR016Cp [Eremothecium gossypii ATCC 10895]|uniref:ADR016Cp n=1 Tax=Eremothecium gossypii (strain ATCC 10895 / CBS 109.51 / FGSC 9923 / NRRL Y-1056) TaxID=284811 RepID=Q75AA2_EREGS|nr:ADR016Cp [Eremothecium gossypii ATCC 10895]AAS51936.1 ADR016Cp [Eremothecium gossypii ATCC 10895]AEY96236.1 FADR016Cp [Eremothecium gossypii FDAG1]
MSHSRALSKFSTCDVADGLLNFCGIDDGGFLGNLTQWSGSEQGTLVGPAYTVLFDKVENVDEEVNYIDSLPRGVVLVIGLPLEQQLPTAPHVIVSQALYGGLMSTRAQYLGSRGTIVFGRVRDVDEHRQLNYPVFSHALGVCAPRMAVKPAKIGVALPILMPDGSVRHLNPGDYVVADENGVVQIPASVSSKMEKLINYIDHSIKADQRVAQDIKIGVPAKQAQRNRRAALKDLIEPN